MDFSHDRQSDDSGGEIICSCTALGWRKLNLGIVWIPEV
uniref:Uncharacterized protein n=1 Tax=Arundo donax TaxID=35708 RepID=A0A0A9AFB6_ARUDO